MNYLGHWGHAAEKDYRICPFSILSMAVFLLYMVIV